MAGVLEGVRAVEWAAFGNGPITGVLLGNLGADVIKIERRLIGDPTRGTKSLYGTALDTPQGRNLLFESANLNKRSLALDLNKEGGKKIFYRLIEHSDIFYTNYFEDSASKIGLDYDTLSKHNSRLIYASASGYGSKGPDRSKRAFDPAVLARSGMMMSAGERGEPPVQIVGAIVDTQGALMTVMGILGALFVRESKGIGQKIEASMLAGMSWLQYTNFFITLMRGRGLARHSRLGTKNPLTNFYRCKDEKWLLFAEIQSDRYWSEFCDAVGITEHRDDERFSDSMKRRENTAELIVILDRIIATKTREQWLDIFKTKGVGFAYEVINSVSDLTDDRQMLENEFIVPYEHALFGDARLLNFPVKFNATPAEIKSHAPELGQHTEEVLLEIGYSWEDISRLSDEEVI